MTSVIDSIQHKEAELVTTVHSYYMSLFAHTLQEDLQKSFYTLNTKTELDLLQAKKVDGIFVEFPRFSYNYLEGLPYVRIAPVDMGA